MSDVILWGATGQSRVLKDAMEGHGHRLVAIFDNRDIPSPFSDIPLRIGEAGFIQWASLQEDLSRIRASVAIGGDRGAQRLALQEWLAAKGVAPITIVHKSAFRALDSVIGDGSQVLAMAAVCANTKIGRSVIINTSASVDHCCEIGDGSHIGPGATLTGEIVLGRNVFVGAGATILPRLRIGDGAIIGAGSVVTKNVAPGAVVIGNPARLQTKPIDFQHGGDATPFAPA